MSMQKIINKNHLKDQVNSRQALFEALKFTIIFISLPLQFPSTLELYGLLSLKNQYQKQEPSLNYILTCLHLSKPWD